MTDQQFVTWYPSATVRRTCMLIFCISALVNFKQTGPKNQELSKRLWRGRPGAGEWFIRLKFIPWLNCHKFVIQHFRQRNTMAIRWILSRYSPGSADLERAWTYQYFDHYPCHLSIQNKMITKMASQTPTLRSDLHPMDLILWLYNSIITLYCSSGQVPAPGKSRLPENPGSRKITAPGRD